MEEKIKIDLGSIQKTLLLPLWGRAMETLRDEPLLIDNASLEIVKKLDYDFHIISKNLNVITRLAWIGRTLLTDITIRNFLMRNPNGTIVDLGCGMDTNFERLDNGTLRWYDLDLPDVIELRKFFFRETDRRKFIACSLMDDEWTRQVIIDENVIFIAAGVLYYFDEEQVKQFILNLAGKFPQSEILFDAASPLGVRTANKTVIKNIGLDERSFLRWSLEKTGDLLSWDNGVAEVTKLSFFKDIRNSLNFSSWLGTYVSDLLNIMYMVHVKFK
jgi:O-methyltransferase involved in polyketide biosynthesis